MEIDSRRVPAHFKGCFLRRIVLADTQGYLKHCVRLTPLCSLECYFCLGGRGRGWVGRKKKGASITEAIFHFWQVKSETGDFSTDSRFKLQTFEKRLMKKEGTFSPFKPQLTPNENSNHSRRTWMSMGALVTFSNPDHQDNKLKLTAVNHNLCC